MFGGGPFLCAAPRLFLFGQEPVKLEIQIHQTALEGLHLGRQPVVIGLGREVEKRQQDGYVLVNFFLGFCRVPQGCGQGSGQRPDW